MVGDIRTVLPPDIAPPGGHYSHGVVANGLVFISGQLPIAPDGTKLVDASFAEQAAQTLANVASILAAAESGISRLVQVRAYVTDVRDWPEFNAIFASWAGDSKPARAVVPVPHLHFGLRIEVEAVALAGRSPRTCEGL